MTPLQLLGGLGMQALWIAAGVLALKLSWNAAVRQYSAVGG